MTVGEIHPACLAFPEMKGAEFRELVESIRRDGLQHPIVVDRSGRVLLDGRNRLRACEEAGVRPEFIRYEGRDPVGFIVRSNLRRRQLTAGQRAAIAHDVLPIYEAEARQHMAGGGRRSRVGRSAQGFRTPARARERAAEAAGASGRSVGQFKRVAEKAPELAERVRSGDLALDAAEKRVREAAQTSPAAANPDRPKIRKRTRVQKLPPSVSTSRYVEVIEANRGKWGIHPDEALRRVVQNIHTVGSTADLIAVVLETRPKRALVVARIPVAERREMVAALRAAHAGLSRLIRLFEAPDSSRQGSSRS